MMEGEIVTGRAATEGRGGVERRKREGERRGKSKEGREELKGSGTVDLRKVIEDNRYECQLMT